MSQDTKPEPAAPADEETGATLLQDDELETVAGGDGTDPVTFGGGGGFGGGGAGRDW